MDICGRVRLMGGYFHHECLKGDFMIVQLQTARGKVNVSLSDEFETAKIASNVARELRESKRLDMLKPYKITGFKYGKDR